jgi:hypothetical protein
MLYKPKYVLAVSLLTASTICAAADKTSTNPCEYSGREYAVKVDKSQHPTPAPTSDKAILYVLATDLGVANETRLFMDGKLFGGARHNSYAFIELQPGEHHLCASGRLHFEGTAAVTIPAEPGRVYFVEHYLARGRGIHGIMRLTIIDPDQGQIILKKLHPTTIAKR